LVRGWDVRLMNFGFRISDFGFFPHPTGTRDACPMRLRAGRSAVTSNRDLHATAKSGGRSRVVQPSRLPGGRAEKDLGSRIADHSFPDRKLPGNGGGGSGNPKSEIRNPTSDGAGG
jgi:hypothetical protein